MPKKENIRKIIGMGVMSLFLLGCSKNAFLLTEEESLEMKNFVEGQTNSESQMVSEEKDALEVNVSSNEEDNGNVEENLDAAKETNENEHSQAIVDEKQLNAEMVEEIVVHICGAVKNTGVYFFEKGQRVYDAIEMAGGLREDADGEYLNQALLLEDGMKIVVPTIEEVKQLKEKEENEYKALGEVAGEQMSAPSYVQYPDTKSSTAGTAIGDSHTEKVNLNTADESLLCTLPGIGTSRAKSIIDYRNRNGSFKRIEDVMKVSGIKEAAFEKIKDKITVSD